MENESFSQSIDKLKFQVKSFQEGFSLLVQSGDLQELGRNFHHLLRGNFLVTDFCLFHKNGEGWRRVYGSTFEETDVTTWLKPSDQFVFESVSGQKTRLAITLPLIDQTHFGLLIGQKLDRTDFGETDTIALHIFLQQLDNAYQFFISQKKEKQFSFDLNHRVVQLNSLIDTGIELSKLNNNSTLFETSVERVVSITNASFGVLQILEKGHLLREYSIPEGVPGEFILKSDNLIQSEIEFQSKTYLFTLADKESRAGAVPFEATDELLLGAFARQVLTALENEAHHEESIEIEALKRELSVAADIQKKIIPEKLPGIEGYTLAGLNIPSKEVGGDYYDCFPLGDGRFALIMADVAGKGVPAALLVSTLNASLSAYMSMNMPLKDLAGKLNSIIYKASPADKFITCLIAVLEPETGKLAFVNAGHNPGFVLRADGSMEKIDAGGIPLGMLNMGLPFDSAEIVIQPGEKLLLYTDGIPEAMNEVEEEYTDEKFEQFFQNHSHPSPEKFISDLLEDVKLYTGSAPQSDDITVLYLGRN